MAKRKKKSDRTVRIEVEPPAHFCPHVGEINGIEVVVVEGESRTDDPPAKGRTHSETLDYVVGERRYVTATVPEGGGLATVYARCVTDAPGGSDSPWLSSVVDLDEAPAERRARLPIPRAPVEIFVVPRISSLYLLSDVDETTEDEDAAPEAAGSPETPAIPLDAVEVEVPASALEGVPDPEELRIEFVRNGEETAEVVPIVGVTFPLVRIVSADPGSDFGLVVASSREDVDDADVTEAEGVRIEIVESVEAVES